MCGKSEIKAIKQGVKDLNIRKTSTKIKTFNWRNSIRNVKAKMETTQAILYECKLKFDTPAFLIKN